MVEEGNSLDHSDDLHRTEEECLREEVAILRRAAEDMAQRRTQLHPAAELAIRSPVVDEHSFSFVAKSLEESSLDGRNAIARALFDLDPPRATSFFNRVLRETTAERRREIAAALDGSGLAAEALDSAEKVDDQPYQAFALLLLLAKAGDAKPLVSVIEKHPRIDLRLAVINMLEQSGAGEVVPVFQELAANTALPDEVQGAMLNAIQRLGVPASSQRE